VRPAAAIVEAEAVKNTSIAWCDHTFNPWLGCTKVSPGCEHCYAATWGRRFGMEWGPGAPRKRTSAAYWRQPLAWDRAAEKAYHADPAYFARHRPRVFCGSLCDWLDDEVPIEWLADFMDLVRACENLQFLLLTKRPQNWKRRLLAALKHNENHGMSAAGHAWMLDWYAGIAPANVWLGTTVEDQQRADERIPQLLAIPAKVRFLSCEPMLCEPLLGLLRAEHLTPPREINEMFSEQHSLIDWIICGCESGPRRRPMQTEWAISLRAQCRAAGVPFFMKQMEIDGKVCHDPAQFPAELQAREFPG